MKIIFTQDALINAGTERSNLELISRFSGEINAALVYFYPRHELKEDYRRAGIRLFFLDIPEKYHLILGIKRLVKVIRKEKPDLLVSSLWRADIITRIASWITGVPLVGTLVNDSYSEFAWKDKSGWKHQVVYWLDRLTAKIPVHWIANAQALVDSHHKILGLDLNRMTVVYRGREIPVPRSKTEGPIRNFISYGRLLERKGFQDAIQAFANVTHTYPDCTLTIFGEGPYRKELKKLIDDLQLQNAVFLPGKISNPMEVLLNGYFLPERDNQLPTTDNRQPTTDPHPEPVEENPQPASTPLSLTTDNRQPTSFHCFLFPSWYEGFSGALVEAMMAGIPIIASDIPMNLEAVEDQKSALLFPVNDLKGLEEKMRFAIEHPALMESLGQVARKVAIQKFDIELIAQQYESTLKEIYRKIK